MRAIHLSPLLVAAILATIGEVAAAPKISCATLKLSKNPAPSATLGQHRRCVAALTKEAGLTCQEKPRSFACTLESRQQSKHWDLKILKEGAIGAKRVAIRIRGVILLFDQQDVIAWLETSFKKHGFSEDGKMLSWVRSARTCEIIDLNAGQLDMSRITYLIADLLERERFALHDARGRSLSSVLRLRYAEACGPRCGSNGRRVYLPSSCKELLEAVGSIK